MDNETKKRLIRVMSALGAALVIIIGGYLAADIILWVVPFVPAGVGPAAKTVKKVATVVKGADKAAEGDQHRNPGFDNEPHRYGLFRDRQY